MSKLIDLLQKKNILLSIFLSLVFTEFYYFGKSSRILISNNYLLLNTIYLFIFSLIFFFILLLIINKFKIYFSEKKLKFLMSFFFTFIYFKIIQIPFFLANTTELKGLISIILERLITTKLYILIPFLKIIIPYLIIFILIYIFIEKNFKFFINFIISFSLIFFTFMFFDAFKRKDYLNNISVKDNIPKNNKKVLWFILDEYDPSYIGKENNSIELNNIVNLTNRSFNHKNSYSPSDFTLHSVPSILMQDLFKGHSFKNFNFYLHDKKNKKIKFELSQTFFSKLINENFNFEIISEVLPYCSMLKINSSCRDNHNKPLFYFDAIKQSYLPLGYLLKIQEYFVKKNEFDFKKINKFQIKDKDLFLSKKLSIDTDNLDELINNKKNLTFLHLFIPHTKTIVIKHVTKAFGNTFPKNDNQEYLLNLKYTDHVIQKILEAIERSKNNQIMLILSSDHWRRIDSPDKPKPSLLVVKIKKDNSKIELSKKNSNIFIGDIILEYLRGNINKHNEIISLFNNNEFEINDVYISEKN